MQKTNAVSWMQDSNPYETDVLCMKYYVVLVNVKDAYGVKLEAATVHKTLEEAIEELQKRERLNQYKTFEILARLR